MKKDHLASNDYPCHSKIKKSAKKISTKNTRNRLKRDLAKLVKE
jgi:hypothetical protein